MQANAQNNSETETKDGAQPPEPWTLSKLLYEDPNRVAIGAKINNIIK